jgi:serine protease Do
MQIKGLGEVAERVRRSTVLVQPGGRGSGSGVIWRSDGLIVTNAHVARGSRIGVSLWDGREFRAEVTARDPRRDLAALRIEATSLNAAMIGDSARVRAGELAIAVGNPLGFLGALTTGMVHAVGPLRGLGSRHWVQADVRLAPGNSGGPLADSNGRVIGINTMAAGRLALAIPSNDVARFLAGDSKSNWMGVTVTPVRLPRGSRQSFGLLVMGIEPESPAANASLLLGDILLGSDGRAFQSVEDFANVLQGEGSRLLRLEFLRGEYTRVRRVSVQLGVRGRQGGSIAA